jgi:hypothetical protein
LQSIDFKQGEPDQCYLGSCCHVAAAVIPKLIVDQQSCMMTRRNCCGDLGQMQVHRDGIAPRQNKGRALAVLGADGAKGSDG